MVSVVFYCNIGLLIVIDFLGFLSCASALWRKKVMSVPIRGLSRCGESVYDRMSARRRWRCVRLVQETKFVVDRKINQCWGDQYIDFWFTYRFDSVFSECVQSADTSFLSLEWCFYSFFSMREIDMYHMYANENFCMWIRIISANKIVNNIDFKFLL